MASGAECKRQALCYTRVVKHITWNLEKNEFLENQRSISFEDVVLHISLGGIVDTFPHPNQERYPDQQIHVIAIEGYAYLVPLSSRKMRCF